jgi:hypothetical protein
MRTLVCFSHMTPIVVSHTLLAAVLQALWRATLGSRSNILACSFPAQARSLAGDEIPRDVRGFACTYLAILAMDHGVSICLWQP